MIGRFGFQSLFSVIVMTNIDIPVTTRLFEVGMVFISAILTK